MACSHAAGLGRVVHGLRSALLLVVPCRIRQRSIFLKGWATVVLLRDSGARLSRKHNMKLIIDIAIECGVQPIARFYGEARNQG